LGSLRKKISTKFRNRYRIILRRDDNLEEKVSVVLTPFNVLILISTGLLLFGAVIYLLLAYTPLNHFFPTKSAKYSGMEQYKMTQKIDSLETSLGQLMLQSDILGKVLAGEDVSINMADLEELDEELEVAFEAPVASSISIRPAEPSANNYNFFVPLMGVVSDTFNLDRKHLAVDIAAKSKEVIKSVQKGSVIFAAWTPNGGHTLIIQHPGNFISVYKHNAVLLKNEGAFVNAGDAIALVGNTGELSSGPHLHFELWKRGVAVNPQNYINF
jgi:murein DD-endopeptidase MepM/ murein hydrolase activator NlpD